jgi:hypothetical protein
MIVVEQSRIEALQKQESSLRKEIERLKDERKEVERFLSGANEHIR